LSGAIPTPLSSHPDLDRGPRKAALILVAALAAFLVMALIWMSFASLDISVQAMGKVVPSSRVQTIQSLEGGIIRNIAVREGQVVKRGDLLANVENLQYNAELGEGQQTQHAIRAAITRLNAEVGDKTLVFDKGLRQQVPGLVAEQQKLWNSRRKELEASVAVAQGQINQRQKELAEARARVESLGNMLALAGETQAMEENLLAQGAGANADLLRARQEVSRLEGDLEAAKINVLRVDAALAEATSRLSEVQARYRAESSRELSDLAADSATLTEKLTAQQDRVNRRELRSPMDGVVNRLIISTEGGIAKPGETIMELVPANDAPLVAARVKPADIAFIHPGQAVMVRITAYDSSIFGSLPGKVVRVGADALLDEREEPYFEVYVETERNYLGKPEERLTISPGMTADTSIQTGKRTFMEYLLKPVIKTLDKGLRER
jgi:adhesin transport system membrane fusion protein